LGKNIQTLFSGHHFMAKKITQYHTVEGIRYKMEADDTVVNVLSSAHRNVARISILYGNTKTGKPMSPNSQWHTGYVGVGSTSDKLPVLLGSKDSMGGACIMDTSIIEIRSDSPKGAIVYTLRPQNLTGVEKMIVEAFSP
jgi:hypothetical protein